MPGIIVTTAVRTGPTNVQTAATATMFVAGVTERGPDGTVHLITSLSDYQDIFGGSTASGWTYETIETFFEEGGARAYVSRVVSSSALEASLVLQDEDAVDVMTLTASGKGEWAHGGVLQAQVLNPSPTTFKVRILLNSEIVYTTQTHASVASAVNEINNSAVAALYVTAADEGEETIPAVLAATNFASGLNGATIANADVNAAIDLFVNTLGPGAVCAPGFTAGAVREHLIAHAAANRRIAVMGFDKDATVSDAIDDLTDYSSADGAEYAAFFYPWVKIPNGTLTKTIPCEGYVCAKRAKAHNERGSWTPYAGEQSQASFVIAPYAILSSSESESLDAGYVNAIKVIAGTTRIYGARSASSDTDNFRFITAREVLNQIVNEAENALEALLFQPIDGRRTLFSRVAATLTAIMDRIRTAGGLYEAYDGTGKQIDPGYTVQVNDAINPVSQLATGVIGGEITASVEKIYIGGEKFPETLCAPSEVGDITLTKHYSHDVRTTLKDLRGIVGRAYYEIKIYDTDCDIANRQSERIYSKALLVGLSEPEGDASSGAPATFALTFAISGAPTQ